MSGWTGKYLIRNVGKGRAHLWSGSDTLCRQWSTGGLMKRNYSVQGSKDAARPVCALCAKGFARPVRSAPEKAAFAEAMRDAMEIRRWTDGPNPASWRVYRLARALVREGFSPSEREGGEKLDGG